MGSVAGGLILRPCPDGRYGASFREFRSNVDWGALRFAFITEDGSGIYHTTGRLDNGRIEGTTHALGRGFLSVWTAQLSAGE